MKKIWFRTCNFMLLLAVFCSNVSAQENSGRAIKPGVPVDISATKLIDLVKASDPVLVRSKNEAQLAHFLREKNSKIIDYLVAKYPQYGVPDVDVNDPATTWFGLICAMYEAIDFRPLNGVRFDKVSYLQEIPTWLGCAVTVLGASFGIGEIVSSLGTFSYGSVWTVVKFVVKKYVTGWLGTAIALYKIADECF